MSYKNVIGARRASWRIISSIEQKEETKGNASQVAKIKTYREKVEAELKDVCDDILNLLDQHLIPAAVAGESKVSSSSQGSIRGVITDPLLVSRIRSSTTR